MKKLSSIAIVLLLLFSFILTTSASTVSDIDRVDPSIKVHDLAELFTAAQKEELSTKALQLIAEYNIDVVIATTNNARGRNQVDYANDFYDYNNFGISKTKDGILFLIDMDNRNIHLSTTGRAIRIFTDHNVDYVMDNTISTLQNSGDYYKAANMFLQTSEQVLSEWPKYQHKVATISFSVGIVFSAGAVFLLWILRHKSTKPGGINAQHYIPYGTAKIYKSNDKFVTSYLNRVPIPKNDNGGGGGSGGGGPSFSGGSSSSSSSSGTSHGGGSRSF